LAGLVHDLKSPMIGADKTLTHLVQKLGDKLSSEDMYLLALLKDNNQRLLQMVNNFLAAVRYEEGQAALHFQLLKFVPLIHSCLEEMSLLARGRGVVMVFAPVHVNIEIRADEQAIRSLLTNLLSNAIKFAGENGTVVVSLQTIMDTVEVRVCDSGPGIPEADLPGLFQRFWQSEGSRAVSFGTGLGLYLCRQIVEHHGGRISYEKDQCCTTFSVILPASPVLPAEIYNLACAPAKAI